MRLTLSNSLILISAIITIIAFWNENLYEFWMNKYFFYTWNYLFVLIQFFLYSFLHGWVFHLLFNSIFVYYFWNKLENYLWNFKYLLFFLIATIFNWICILYFTSWNTIWISWFAMALLSFLTLKLFELKNDEYKWWIMAIVLNIVIWFTPWISFVWHFSWVIIWVIFYFIDRFLLQKRSF